MDLETVTDKLLERNSKRLILMCMDTCFLIVSMILSRLFLDVIIDIPDERFILAVLFVSILYLILSFRLKVFSLITRYTGYQSYVKIGLSLISAHSLFLIISMVL
nr:Cps5E [Streptococcus suis]